MNQAFYYSCFRSLVVLSLTLTGLGGLLGGCQPKPEPEPVAVNIPRKISALGRIEPETKIRKVAVSSSLSGDRIDDILVEENQVVEKGYPLAILNSYGTLKAALDEANQLVALLKVDWIK
jgi:HlyD family secretion protein